MGILWCVSTAAPCLQLWNKEGRVVRLEGDPLEVAQWLLACHDAGIKVSVQVNESVTP